MGSTLKNLLTKLKTKQNSSNKTTVIESSENTSKVLTQRRALPSQLECHRDISLCSTACLLIRSFILQIFECLAHVCHLFATCYN